MVFFYPIPTVYHRSSHPVGLRAGHTRHLPGERTVGFAGGANLPLAANGARGADHVVACAR
jgi:hypothetical protein